MKTKLIISLVFLLACVTIKAQENKTTIAVRTGISISNLSGDIEHNHAKVGFNFGVIIDCRFTDNFSLLTGIDAMSKGTKLKGTVAFEIEGMPPITENITVSLNPIYLQVPIHIGYKIKIAENTKLIFRAGPYVAYGAGGLASGKLWGLEDSVGLFRAKTMRSIDFGLGLGTGVEFGKIGVNLGYDFGLIDVWNSKVVNIKNRNFYIAMSYRL